MDDAPPAMHTLSCTGLDSSSLSTPAKSKLLMPQVTFHPLPVLQEGEGLEDDENENKINDSVTVNFVSGDDL